jgi:hypothetical protein
MNIETFLLDQQEHVVNALLGFRAACSMIKTPESYVVRTSTKENKYGCAPSGILVQIHKKESHEGVFVHMEFDLNQQRTDVKLVDYDDLSERANESFSWNQYAELANYINDLISKELENG